MSHFVETRPMPNGPIDITGMRFGRLVAKNLVRRTPSGYVWRFSCDCGNTCESPYSAVNRGRTNSCGCLYKETRGKAQFKHGHAIIRKVTPTYVSWQHMIRRTTSPNDKNWNDYGGRGIKVCERWKAYENFLADMGQKPAGLTLDRIDVDGNYEPANCRWSTRYEQVHNRRCSRPKSV